MAKLTETKKVVYEKIEEVLIGRTCDFCKKPIEEQSIMDSTILLFIHGIAIVAMIA